MAFHHSTELTFFYGFKMKFSRESKDLQAVVFYVTGLEFYADHIRYFGVGSASWVNPQDRNSDLAVGSFNIGLPDDLEECRGLALSGWLTEAIYKHKAYLDNLKAWLADPEIPARKLRRAIATRTIPTEELGLIEGWKVSDLVRVMEVLSAKWPDLQSRAYGRGIKTAIQGGMDFLEKFEVEKEDQGI